MLPFRLNADAPLSVGEIKAHFEALNVATRPIIAGNLVRHPAMRNIQHRTAHSLAVADDLLARGFMLGCHPVLEPGALEVLQAAFQSLGQHRAR